MQQTIKIKHRRKKTDEYREVKNFVLSVSLWQLLNRHFKQRKKSKISEDFALYLLMYL